MGTRVRPIVVWMLLGTALPAGAQQVGELCAPFTPPMREGIVCAPAFVEIDGQLREEWKYVASQVLNARKGDAVLSPGCGRVGTLLRKVDPPHQNSHSGIMTIDRTEIRHSTAVEDRYPAFADDGGSGIREDVLRYGWPGPITEFIDEAFEGKFLADPETGETYLARSFNTNVNDCDGSGDVVPATVLKPAPDAEAAHPEVRVRLNEAANIAGGLFGHYRFFGFTDPSDIVDTPISGGGWADGSLGSVCSALIWRAMRDVSFTLEGGVLEPEEITKGVQIDPSTPDGLYHYSEAERLAAASWLYQEFYDLVDDQINDFENFVSDAADNLGNQIVNCFGFDWCGETRSPQADAQCAFEPRAQESTCWHNPGSSEAVGPDDLMSWDAPPAGPYGYREDLVYGTGEYVRVNRWAAAPGTGTVKGKVTDGGQPVPGILVIVDGLGAGAITKPDGRYLIEGVPATTWTIRTCNLSRGGGVPAAVPADGTVTANIALGPSCDPQVDPGLNKRKLVISVDAHIVDTEDLGSDEVEDVSQVFTLLLEPGSEAGDDQLLACTGGEVRTKVTFDAMLDVHDRSIDVAIAARMYEAESCPNDDLNASWDKLVTIPEDGVGHLVVHLLNEEWGGQDTLDLDITLENQVDS